MTDSNLDPNLWRLLHDIQSGRLDKVDKDLDAEVVQHYCSFFSSQQQHRANTELAYYSALKRGATSIAGRRLETHLGTLSGKGDICPVTFQFDPFALGPAYLFPPSDDGRETWTLFGMLQGWLPYDEQRAERERRHPSLMVPLHFGMVKMLEEEQLVLVPIFDLLRLLTVDLEDRIADSLSVLGDNGANEEWELSTVFGAERAETSYGQGMEEVLDAHPFDVVALSDRDSPSYEEHDDTCKARVRRHHIAAAAATTGDGSCAWTNKWDPAWPAIYSFLSPSVAVTFFVHMVQRSSLPVSEELKPYWDLARYFCELETVSSGKTWAEAVGKARPSSSSSSSSAQLPPVSRKVREVVERHGHGGDERHTRRFCRRPREEVDEVGESASDTKRKRAKDDEGEQSSRKQADVGDSSSNRDGTGSTGTGKGKQRASSEDWPEGALEDLEPKLFAAASHYEALRARFFDELSSEFAIGGGGTLSISLLLEGLEAVCDAVGEARAQELRALVKTKREAEERLREVLELWKDARRGYAYRVEQARRLAPTGQS